MSWIGWTGSAIYLVAQMLLVLSLINKRHYTFLNAIAALLVSIYSVAIFSIQPIIINVLWSALSFYALNKRYNKVATNAKLCSLLILVAIMITIAFWSMTNDFLLALSIVSIWIYSSAYIQYLFFGMRKIFYLLACVVAPAALLPQIWLDGNFPVVAIQVFWLVFSAIGAARLAIPYFATSTSPH